MAKDPGVDGVSRARSTRVWTLTAALVLSLLSGVLGLVGGAVLLGTSDPAVLDLSIAAVGIGAGYIVAGYGLYLRSRWGWVLGLAVSGLSIARNGIETGIGEVAFGIPGLVIAVVVIALLVARSTRGALTEERTPLSGPT
jgi:hypothetical protein